jgi:hypothetical protein
MNEHQALRMNVNDPAPVAPFATGPAATSGPGGGHPHTPGPGAAEHKEYRSGVFAKARRDASGGWGLVLIDLTQPPRTVTLNDGAVVGSTSREARVEGAGVAAEHLRVSVRSDGCYL